MTGFYLYAKLIAYCLYLCISFLYKLVGSSYAGDLKFGSSFKSFWIPVKIFFKVIPGLQSSSSLRILRHTVPDGYILGWGKIGSK